MPDEPLWLTVDDIITINRQEVAATGEQHFVRDLPLLESAVARPRNSWAYGEEDIVDLTVALLLGLALNHPFEQGNKRTAASAAVVFLEINGYEWVRPDDEGFGICLNAFIERQVGEDVLNRLIRDSVR